MPRNAVAFELPADHDHSWPAGGYCFVFNETEGKRVNIGIVHACPCGCGAASGLYFRGLGGGSAEWDVQGEWPKVTLSPSIGIRKDSSGGFHWHGYLRNGVFEEL